MPNHIKNRLTISGDPERIKELFEKYSTHYPETHKKTFDGSLIYRNEDNGEYGWLGDDGSFSTRTGKESASVIPGFKPVMEEAWTRFPDFEKIIPMPKEVEETKNTPGPMPLWYSWSVQNWGTKWNSYSCEQDLENNVYDFETAWSAVPALMNMLAEEFDDLEIFYEWADEDTGNNTGRGILPHAIYLEDGSDEAYEQAIKLRPYLEEELVLTSDGYAWKDDVDED